MTVHTERKTCRICSSEELELVFSMGNQYVIDFVEARDDQALRAPLDLVLCRLCGLLQLKHSVAPDRLFRKFWYRSGINESMRQALRQVANATAIVADLQPGDAVLDIGMNDGTLLQMYPDFVKTVGVDPCTELVHEAVDNKRVDVGIAGYFSAKMQRYGPFKAVTAIAMFYDLEDPGQFLDDVCAVLHPQGVFVLQMNYLLTMFRNLTIDNISHEHLGYYSLRTLKSLFEPHGLEIVGVELNEVNGGSLRVYATRPGVELTSMRLSNDRKVQMRTRLFDLLRQEMYEGLDAPAAYQRMALRADTIKQALRRYLLEQKEAGKRLYLYGASTRGATLLQYLDLPEGTFLGAAERDPHKFGRMTVGTWVPIKPEVDCRQDADVFLLLPYHFREGVQVRERDWIQMGGSLVVPLPEPQVVTREGTFSLLTKELSLKGVV